MSPPGKTVDVLGRGIYTIDEALPLINFRRDLNQPHHPLSRQSLTRWLCGYNFNVNGKTQRWPPLWQPDFICKGTLELSFRDLIELRLVKALRETGLAFPELRDCYERVVDQVQADRVLSTRYFQANGEAVFLKIINNIYPEEDRDVCRRRQAFRQIVKVEFLDLEYDSHSVARWFPLGSLRKTIVLDPTRAFGRPIIQFQEFRLIFFPIRQSRGFD